jgi:hypothetical protein
MRIDVNKEKLRYYLEQLGYNFKSDFDLKLFCEKRCALEKTLGKRRQNIINLYVDGILAASWDDTAKNYKKGEQHA